MRLFYQELEFEILLTQDITNVLYIENRDLFSNCIRDIWNQCDTKAGSWVLSNGDDILPISKHMICVINPINLDLNDRKLIKVLYQDITNDVNDNFNYEFVNLNSKIVSFIDDIIAKQPYQIEFEEQVSLQDILKIYNVQFANDAESILENIVVYIKLWHRVGKISVFSFINLKTYLSEKELLLLYEMARYEQIYLLLIESRYESKLLDETVKIIDNDLCIIEC